MVFLSFCRHLKNISIYIYLLILTDAFRLIDIIGGRPFAFYRTYLFPFVARIEIIERWIRCVCVRVVYTHFSGIRP